MLDLLRVAVGAGLTPWRALAEVGRRHPGVLAAELGAASRRIALGVTAADALDRFERRAPGAASARSRRRCAGPTGSGPRPAGR